MAQIEVDPTKGLNGAIAAELSGEIKAQRRTQKQVCVAAGFSYQTARRYLNGTRHIPIDAAAALAHELGLSLTELVSRAEARLARELRDDSAELMERLSVEQRAEIEQARGSSNTGEPAQRSAQH